MSSSAEEVARHRQAGRFFEAAGLRSFVRESEDAGGDPVVLLHGVPASSYLYRKLLDELGRLGLRGVAFDLPGLGLAERPDGFDYTWTGLGRFARAAVDALELERFHLVVHDIGGPVGFEVAAADPARVRSLTLLNTMVEVDVFERPWLMEPFARPGIGELYLRGVTKPGWLAIMRIFGVLDRTAVSPAEAGAWVDLLKREDDGRAFLQIMRGFERTAEKRDLYVGAVRDTPYPVQVVWGAQDRLLTLAHHGRLAMLTSGVERVHTVPARHFLQEDQAPAVAARVAELAALAS